ncbi:hypothetical protein RchiOBHm_Chr3g0485351 [Rosa chinensis]|uniref:Uncharacterized protein n=1 Tax=Rosa chinensis TaxID=74649 RepID=A0A2P6REZ7_ROSCH|nr:hypothetical protein RchiOBHm_Chr3g0485351 [Rosa chinensis]
MMLMLFGAMRLKKKKMRRTMDEVEVAVKHKTCQFWRLGSVLKVSRCKTSVSVISLYPFAVFGN